MASKKWKEIMGAIAPSIGMALGGPLGGIATNSLAKALLGEDAVKKGTIEANRQRIDSLLQNGLSAGQLEAVKKAEHDFTISMKKMDVNLEALHARDRESARHRQTEMKDNWPNWLALIMLLGFFLTTAYVLIHGMNGMDAPSAAFIGTLVGYVSAKADQVIAYFFGSSMGSQRKTDALAEAARERRL